MCPCYYMYVILGGDKMATGAISTVVTLVIATLAIVF